MIDLHCHLLPGIDDGAIDVPEAIKMAQMAGANGIQTIVVTPHIHPGRFDNEINTIRPAFIAFQQVLHNHHIPLHLGMAAEVRIGPEILPMLEQQRIPFLGTLDNHAILLLELPYTQIPLGTDKIIQWLLNKKIRPLLAHPERNSEIVTNFKKLQPLIDLGCWLQITANSLTGQFGKSVQHCAKQLLDSGWVNVIATDAHNSHSRPPDLDSGRKAAAKIVGETTAWALVRDIPQQIIRESDARDWC